MLFASFFWLLVIHALQKVRPQIRNLHKQNPAAKQRLRATLEKNKDLLSLIMSFSLYKLPTWRLEERDWQGSLEQVASEWDPRVSASLSDSDYCPQR